jgi:uncharacterized protein YeaO (DUF488 family)
VTGITIKRIHEKPAPADGRRVLVDRLWPRGIRKAAAALDNWRKDLAPSPELRQWFGHDPERFAEFRRHYRAELRKRAGEILELARQSRKERITLLYAARDPVHNHARVLAEVLTEALKKTPPSRPARKKATRSRA